MRPATRRRALALTVTAALTAALAGCSVPSRPAWWPSASPSASGPAGAEAAMDPDVPHVAKPWAPGARQLGINVYWENSPKDPDDVVRAKARRVLDYTIGLGANSIAVSFPFYTDGIRSNRLFADTKTPSAEKIGILLDEAKKSRMRMTVRPVLNEDILIKQDPKAWRGKIAPASRDQWFAAYQKLLLPYATVAEQHDAATFVIGTELNSMEGDQRWAPLAEAVKAVYTGELSYSVNYDSFLTGKPLPAQHTGVDAYPPMPLDDNATVDQLVAGWKQFLDKRPGVSDLLLAEVGIAAQNGGYRLPGHWGSASRPLNLTVQQRWYEAVCRVLMDRKLSGVYWWAMTYDTDPATADPKQDDRLSFVNRPAQDVIKTCFADAA